MQNVLVTVYPRKQFGYHRVVTTHFKMWPVSERTKVAIKHDLQNLDLLRTKYKYIWDSEIWARHHKVANEFNRSGPKTGARDILRGYWTTQPACPKMGESRSSKCGPGPPASPHCSPWSPPSRSCSAFSEEGFGSIAYLGLSYDFNRLSLEISWTLH